MHVLKLDIKGYKLNVVFFLDKHDYNSILFYVNNASDNSINLEIHALLSKYRLPRNGVLRLKCGYYDFEGEITKILESIL